MLIYNQVSLKLLFAYKLHIAQSDTIKIEYVTGWLKKISLAQLLFEYGNFSKPLSFFKVLL